VSKDEDFTHMVLNSSKAGLLWVRIGNCRRAFFSTYSGNCGRL
jgi:hypothetical protein